VPLGDFEQLALKIEKNLKKPFERDGVTNKILRLYSSWDRVALEECNHLDELLNFSAREGLSKID
jgi:hypothetical protein